MKIYVAHSSGFDFKNDLYFPIRNSQLNTHHDFFLPMEHGEPLSRDIIKNSDLFLAEVSYPSTGMGIEMGWADVFQVPIVCIHKEGSKYSSALSLLSKVFISYKDQQDMIEKLTQYLSK